jgi:hypothetical protein
MVIFLYTFFVVIAGISFILGVGGVIANIEEKEELCGIEGVATSAMCTTNLLERSSDFSRSSSDDFVIEQDMVYTYDSINL